jgi:nitrilase
MIIGPGGKVISDVFSSDEGLCIADINLGDSIVPKRMHDIVGYYNRYDVFDLNVTIKRDFPVKMRGPGCSVDEVPYGQRAASEKD